MTPPSAVVLFAESLIASADELTAAVMERVSAELPDWMRQPEILDASRDFTGRSLRTELEHLRDGAPLPDACPAADRDGARRGAAAGVPLDVLLRGYRAGHAVQWERWFAAVEADGRPPERRALLEHGSAFFFAYADRLSTLVTREYVEERDRTLRTAEQRRVHLVRRLLDGEEAVDPGELGYPLAGTHVGLIASGPGSAALTRAIAARAGRPVLLIGVVDDVQWGWIAAGDVPRPPAPPAGTRLALGLPERGRDGFRRTHAQALAAHASAQADGAAVTSYDAIALEHLAGRDPELARAFTARELDGLEADDARTVRLRETLAAYLAAGLNAAGTAAVLGVHEQTVANRLRVVEQCIGRTVASRHVELAVALRLRALAAPVDPPDA